MEKFSLNVHQGIYKLREKLTDALKKLFMKKKKTINSFDCFYISYESNIKTFLKYFINNRSKSTVSMIHILFYLFCFVLFLFFFFNGTYNICYLKLDRFPPWLWYPACSAYHFGLDWSIPSKIKIICSLI